MWREQIVLRPHAEAAHARVEAGLLQKRRAVSGGIDQHLAVKSPAPGGNPGHNAIFENRRYGCRCELNSSARLNRPARQKLENASDVNHAQLRAREIVDRSVA